jgi:hypothetical protein
MRKARPLILSVAVLLAAATGAASAEPAKTVRVRGTVEQVEGNMLTVKSRDGGELRLKLKDNAGVRAVVPAKLSDIKAGIKVGITSMPQADGGLKAVEVHIFPAGLNVRLAHFPWDLMPNSFMTNGSVETSVAAIDGHVLTVSYRRDNKVEEKKITVTPQTAIVAYDNATAADLKPGVKVFVANAPVMADGTIEVASISYGKDGMTPPM